MNYLQTIFTSYYTDPNCLTDLLLQAKRDNNILDTVFYSECTVVLKDVKECFNERLAKDFEKINLCYLTENLTPVQEASLDEQLKKCTLENITIQLLTITNGLFAGKLHYSEVEFIEKAINELQAPKPKEDVTFVINIFENSEEKLNHNFESLKYQIENNGCFIVNNAKIYTTELSYFLSLKTLKAFNKSTKTQVEICGYDYIKTYTTAYDEGRQYFENEFKPSISILYGSHAESYIQNICDNYFKIHHYGAFKGWNFVKHSYPISINHEVIKQFGYYAGIVSKVDELVDSHLNIFEKFDVHEDENKNILKGYQIEEFNTSFNAGLFDDRITLEKQKSIINFFNNWYKKADSEYTESSIFGTHKEILFSYNKMLLYFSLNIIELYKAIDSYTDTGNDSYLPKIIINRDKISKDLTTIKSYVIKIKKQSLISTDEGLIKTREYTTIQLNEIIHELQNNYTIDLLKSPFKDEIEQIKNELQNSISTDLILKIDNDKPKKERNKTKTINDFIFNINNQDDFLRDLKEEFKTEKGISFKILIELLKDEKIFLFSNFAEFFRNISPLFNNDIGSQRGLNDLYKHTESDKKIYKAKIDLITEKLKPLIIRHKIKN
jgi:hypothetical protein